MGLEKVHCSEHSIRTKMTYQMLVTHATSLPSVADCYLIKAALKPNLQGAPRGEQTSADAISTIIFGN